MGIDSILKPKKVIACVGIRRHFFRFITKPKVLEKC